MKVLVTGGAGYIGSIVTQELIRQGEQVVVLDNLSKGHRAAIHPDAVFVEADLGDRAAVNATFDTYRIDAVMHFASHIAVGESMQKPFLYLRDNISNGLNLMQSAVEHGVRRFILSSTANLFDVPEHVPITEEERIVPGSPYAESKHVLERTLFWLDRIYGLHYASLRYFNAAGASPSGKRGEAHHPETHLVPLVLQVALGQRDHITIFGDDYATRDGTCVRDYIHVVDLAQAHILTLRSLDGGSLIYNLGNGTGFTVKEVIETCREVTGQTIPVVVGQRRPGDLAELIAGSDRIRQDLGWSPRYPDLRTIVEHAWAWHSTHPKGYEE